jgi:hypothetical protein
MNAKYTATWGCSVSGTFGPIAGTISGSTLTFAVPMGVTGVTIDSYSVSDGATISPMTGTLSAGSTVVVTSEAGVAKTYTVALTTGNASSANSLLTFGFEADDNTGTGITVDVAGTITGGLVNVIVPWNTDLYALTAYFTASNFSSVFIAESNGTYTPQCTEVTVNDFSNSLTYVVRAQNGEEERWDVSVTKAAVLTDKEMIGFKLMDLDACVGPYLSANGVYDGMNVTVTVKNGTSVKSLPYSFTVSTGATADKALTGTADFTTPMVVNVTAQNGSVATYTITVVVRNDSKVNSVAKINKYWFAGNKNGFGSDVMGTINETAKTIHAWVPWGTDITKLVASFELENPTYTRMTRSEDLICCPEIMQYSGVSSNDYTTPIAYTVYAENCTTVEYFVTVYITPNTNTGISAFEFCYTDCGCDLGTTIDAYAKRIYVTVPYTVSIKSLAPCKLTIHPEASVKLATKVGGSDAWSTPVDWTKGPVSYVVTAPDGVTKTTWEVLVQNPPCQETDIMSFALPYIQVDPSALNGNYKGDKDHNPQVVTIDKVNHTIEVIIKAGLTDLSKVYYERTLSCGAEICCVSGNCVDNHYLDFSESLCHTCVVTAQDESITQEWTICLVVDDSKCPEVMTESVLAMNCDDTVFVSTNEPGEVFIIHEDAIACIDGYYPCNCDDENPLGDPDLIADFIAEKMLKKVAADSVGSFAIPTQGLYSGVYYAFAIDTWGNVSCQSKQKLYIDICEKEVATLADLKAADPAFMYTVTGEVIVTYEETRTGGNLKYVQDASAGIEIKDVNAGCSVTYGVGTGVTGLKGMMMDVNHLSGNNPCSEEDACSKVFVPICCYSPTVSSKGNVVAPIELTFDQFAAAPRAYDAMFVRINTPIMVWNDYTGSYTFVFDEDRVNADLYTWNAIGDVEYLISTVFNTNYIGEDFPDVPKIFQGINTYYVYDGDCYGSVTPRWVAAKKGDPSDILDVGTCLLAADPNPVTIEGVLPVTGKKSVDIDVINEGSNSVVITAVYLDDLSGQDEFQLIQPRPVEYTLDHWGSGNKYWETVTVEFRPKDAGPESATLVVEFCDGKILEIPISGSTVLVNETPFCEGFNDNAFASNTLDPKYGWSHNLAEQDGIVDVGWFSNNSRYGDSGYHLFIYPYNNMVVYAQTPGFKISGSNKFLQFYHGKLDGFLNGWAGISGISTDPRKILISNDGQKTWTEIWSITGDKIPEVNAAAHFAGHDKIEISLAAYEGETVYFRFQSYRVGAKRGYWIIDEMCVADLITDPIVDVTSEVNFGGVQVGDVASNTVTVKNTGASVFKVTGVAISGAGFTLTDTNTYPIEVEGSGVAFSYDGAGSVSVNVDFAPTDVGSWNGNLVITTNLGVFNVALTGEGLSCFTAAEAVLGENWAASQNSWFTYTAEVFQIAYINSCDPRNTTDPYEYSYDTWLDVYDACGGNLLATNDDLEWDACPYNRASSGVIIPMNAGETVKIFWPWAFTSAHDADGFYFHIEASYPIDGDVCETAIPLTLPVVNHFGTTVGFEDDYDLSPCSPFSNYMDGNDKVYTINLETDGYLTGNILGAYGSIHVLDKCPKEELQKNNCKGFVGGPNGGEFTKRIGAGEYYVIISTWAPPQTVDYLLNMSFEEGSGINDNSLASSLTVYPNPTNGQFTVSISNAEATDLTVELVNISGQVVYRNEVKAVYTYNEDIDASEFAKGVYYLKVNDGSEVKVEKVVIQ